MKEFANITKGGIFLKRVLEWDLIIPEFDSFSRKFGSSFEEIKRDESNRYS